jgi:SAM-dependent methyltransferase
MSSIPRRDLRDRIGATVMSATLKCRACGNEQGQMVLDLGLQPLANNYPLPEDLGKAEPRFPLQVFVCPACWLLQITLVVPPVELFGVYSYQSSFSDAMLRHAREAADRYLREFDLGANSLVVEVASNDGYFLKNFVAANVPCLGIEPAGNIAEIARERGIETLVEFFGLPLADRLAASRRLADLILGNNVFAHAPDINSFIEGLRMLLKPAGRVILEFPYGVELIQKTEFDTIYHEHVFYFTLTPLVSLFRRHGLEIFNVERIPIHGGSLRIFAGHTGAHEAQSSVQEMLEQEKTLGVNSLSFYSEFALQVERLKTDLVEFCSDKKQAGKSMAAYGASAKGSTLLNYCNLGSETFAFVADRSTYKQGRVTPGQHLPIVAPEELLACQPDFTLLLTWNFAEEILGQQKAYRAAGGKFVIPIPRVAVI